CMQSTHIPWTF
nr:immunoglobulin light chain junction region [Macaca mulatta]MOV36992.1 immunoglobulin light chain junction region [Macaca mulatta]MOV37179.1 immunoglobulin light chain junction region [Macaca mulatta]MOV37254.1 immunoglobulin light chain junction region [Macaca mulatta]MOV37563.1 immunoglobulin light chain junction region [Macaca mulatta]